MSSTRGRGSLLRISYVCYWFLLEKDGVAHKIAAQVDRWRQAGHEVQVFCLTREDAVRPGQQTVWRTFPFASAAGRFRATRELVRAAREWSPDVVYLRYDLFLPPLPALVRDVSTVVEINADDKEEAKLRRARARLAAAYNEVNRRVLLSRVRGMVCVTHELAASPHFAGFGQPIEVIGNGVDLDALRPLPPAPPGERPRVAFLGSARQAWHGIDKIAHLAERLPQVDVDVIGYDEARLREALGDRIPANMHPHGILSRAEFEPILARCDLTFGTLALHRKNMHEACPLKIREYLGYGLPVVIGYEDTDLRGVDDWWLLRLPNTESNVTEHVDEIAAFLDSVRGRRVARELVADRIGSEAKEHRRLAFLERVRAA